jgi:hypothetical protein
MTTEDFRSFDAVMRQRAKELLELEAQQQSSHVARAAQEELQALEYAADDKAREIHWIAAEHRGTLDKAAAELEQKATIEARRLEETASVTRDDIRRAAAEEADAFEGLAARRLAELERTLLQQFEMLRRELLDEGRRPRDLTDESRSDHVDEREQQIERSRAEIAALTERIAAFGKKVDRADAIAENQAQRLDAVSAAAKDDVLDALDVAKEGLTQAAAAHSTELADKLEAARTALQQVADSRAHGLEDTASALRDAIEGLHRDLAAALDQSGRDQAAALDRTAAAWLRRIEHAGRKSRRAPWRRTGPRAMALMLAIAAAFGGTLLVRGGGDDRNSVANASLPTSPPAAPTPAPPEPTATTLPEPLPTDSDPVPVPTTSSTATAAGARVSPSTAAATDVTSLASGSSTSVPPSSTAETTQSSTLASASQASPPGSSGAVGSGTEATTGRRNRSGAGQQVADLGSGSESRPRTPQRRARATPVAVPPQATGDDRRVRASRSSDGRSSMSGSPAR